MASFSSDLHRRRRCYCYSYSRFFSAFLLLTWLLGFFAYNYGDYLKHMLALEEIHYFEKVSDRLRLSPEEEDMYRDLLRTFDFIAGANGIPYFLYGGSLIGFYRNRSLMAWDDDVDVSMPWEGYEAFVQTLEALVHLTIVKGKQSIFP